METLKKILLIGLGVTFILSAILKTISVYSFSQTVNSFCGLLGMDVLYGYGFPLAIVIIAFELLIGVCAVIRRFQRIIIWIYTIVLGFFTYITYINYTDLYGGIESCGCFGELIHFTPDGSFYKNIALFVLSLILLGIHLLHTNRRQKLQYGLSVLLVLLLSSCHNQLDNALEQAGDNRQELEKVLNHYKDDLDTLKYGAAKFLIENMPYHYTYQDEDMLHYDSAYVAMAQEQEQFRDSVSMKQQGTSITYFCVSDNNDWSPVYYSVAIDGKITISKMPLDAVSIIAFFEDETIIPVDNPLIITPKGKIEINPSKCVTLYLMRKYHLNIRQGERIFT